MNEEARKKKILVVEDDFYIRDLYKIEAERQGYEVITAADGEEALYIVNTELPDLVLLDLMLPKIDGITVLKQITQDPKLKHIPVVIITNLEDSKKEQEAKELGAADYLLKVKNNASTVMSNLKNYLKD